MRRLLPIVVLTLSSTPAWALDDVMTPRGLAMGSMGRGAAIGALGPMLNPAGIEFARQYTIEAGYGLSVQDVGSNINLSITDSTTNAHIGMGAYYQFVHSSPHFANAAGQPDADVTRQGNEAGISTAVPLGDHFAFGVTLKYANISTDGPNPAATATNKLPGRVVYDSSTLVDAKGFTMDVGILIKLTDTFGIGVVGSNIIPLHSIDTPAGLGFGLGYQVMPNLLLVADAQIDFDRYRSQAVDAMGNPIVPAPDAVGTPLAGDRRTTVRAGGGLEYVAGNVVPIRAGYFQDTGMPGGFISAGVGYLGPSFGIDAGYRGKVVGGNETLLALGLRVFLQ